MPVAIDPAFRGGSPRLYSVSALAFAVFLTARVAGATGEPSGRDQVSADELFRQGRALATAQDYARACPKFSESLRLDPAAGTLLNLADCEEQIGHLANAWAHFKELGDELPKTDERKEVALERARILERRLPHLTIELSFATAPEAIVRRDDVELARASLGVPFPVDPGDHTVLVSQPGRTPRPVVFTLAEGQSRVVVVGPGEAIPLERAEPRSTLHRAKRTAGWIVGGAGIAALATGTYFGVRALERRGDSDAHCNGDICATVAGAQAYEDAKGDARVADVGLGIGIVAVAVAGYLLLTASDAEPPASAPSAQRVTLEVRPVGLGLRW
jgi:tetratricopeptide (TPR) repeat protein